jgi:REP element-mobilizing transposase RayT
VGRFKSLTTRRYLDGVHGDNWQPFPTRLWQRNYYEHIIRDDQDYQSCFDYILANPQNWE